MEENEIVDGTNGPTLATWINRFTEIYGRRPTRMSDLAAFVEEQQQHKASGHIARHDPERMARAQQAGQILEFCHTGEGWSKLRGRDITFILDLLLAVRDGKA